ncbi:XRE family transcriptional regulator [Kibdelosporangium aridum]|uniref:XRE family transcriptional regulator n=1 Tax=Kibdelosporangium aridum TaxID=2030 RepID=A0A428ZBS1_KIBAR|nr:helix-turn-helix transcriptional regulator [Kibdelosporangium aridum]RSM85524.1 XRE family transcriptional regulator [Kibdelosporangium aridum]
MPDSRRELGVFLRSRRARLAPADVGLPRTGRRRTPGLRREELALLAGMSATWYTYLEQGRDIRPSDQVLEALATALRLDRDERDHLFHLAGHAPAPSARERLAPEVAAVPMLLQPNPAYIIDATYDVLSHNQAAEDLFPNLVSDRRANFVRWVFAEPVAKEILIDWEPEARGLLARFRALSARNPADQRFSRLVDELHEASPQVREWWPQYDVRTRRSGRKRLRRPDGEPAVFAYTAFHLAEQPDQTLVIYSDVHVRADTEEDQDRPSAIPSAYEW